MCVKGFYILLTCTQSESAGERIECVTVFCRCCFNEELLVLWISISFIIISIGGTVFHFHMKGLEDYYILNPQWWFDACELVVSQENVTNLVATGGHEIPYV